MESHRRRSQVDFSGSTGDAGYRTWMFGNAVGALRSEPAASRHFRSIALSPVLPQTPNRHGVFTTTRPSDSGNACKSARELATICLDLKSATSIQRKGWVLFVWTW